MMLNVLIFVFLQGLFVNGIQLAMEDGKILAGYKRWLKEQKKWIGQPMGLCVVCSASVGATVTFWPAVIFFYGWHPAEVFAWLMNIPILAVVNFWIFKKM